MSDSNHMKILEAAQNMLHDATLDGIADSNIVIGVLDHDIMRCLPGPPGILITPQTLEELVEAEGTNISDRPEYPVSIAINMTYCVGHASKTEIDAMLMWRQTVRETFSHNNADMNTEAGLEIIADVNWIPGRIFLPGEWSKQNKWLSVCGLKVRTHEQRPAQQ